MTSTAPAASPQGKAPAKAKDVAERPAFEIQPNKFNLREQVCHAWSCVVPAGTEPEDLDLKAKPFALIGSFLSEGDDIRCVRADMSAIIDLVCVHRSGNVALCRPTQVIHIPKFETNPQDAMPKGYEIVLATPKDDAVPGTYLVKRQSDGWVMNANEQHRNYQEALHWLQGHAAVRGDTPMHLLRPTLS